MSERWTIANEFQLEAFIKNVRDLYSKHKKLTYDKPELGFNRSLSQNALFHMWIRDYAGHLLNKRSHLVSEGELEGLKRHAKLMYYRECCENWILHKIINPKTGESKIDVKSTSQFNKGEMFKFMEYIQKMAAIDGLILESRGEYEALQKEQHGE